MGGEADAVVGAAALGEVVGADFLGAVTGADEGAAVLGVFGHLLVEFFLVEAGAHDLEGHFFVFDLGAAVLAADVEAGGEVEDLDGGVCGIDVLAAGAAGAADLDAEVVHVHLDIDFLCLWEDGDGDGGGVDAALGLGGGDALDAVDSGFVFEVAEDFIAGDFEDDFFEAADF